MQTIEERYLAAKRRLFDAVYAEKLNPEQCRAVFCAQGPLLVLAGAGSGKTTVLVNRIAYLVKYGNAYHATDLPDGISEGMVTALEEYAAMPTAEIAELLPQFISDPCPPWQILAFTFTNKAAKEIRDRLAKTFADDDAADDIWAGTFHSICVRILHKYGERLGYRNGFSIYDTDDTKKMLGNCMKELRIDEKLLPVRGVANAISREKDKLRAPAEAVFEGEMPAKVRQLRAIYELYQKKMMEYNAVDFDDIIMKTVFLLQNDAEVREYYQHKFRYVLVDEYQDTNYAQFVLTKLLSDHYRNIMVVGDDDQSIYRFRGATVENILQFDRVYPDATVIKLEQNYRSTETILDAANAVIRHNETRHDKNLWCDKGKGDKILLRELFSQEEEGKYIISRITRMVAEEHRKYADFAVLYRLNELSRPLESAFAKSGVPYRILGATRFYDRKEIRDMVAYLAVANTPGDSLHLKRIVNEPKRKIGPVTLECI